MTFDQLIDYIRFEVSSIVGGKLLVFDGGAFEVRNLDASLVRKKLISF